MRVMPLAPEQRVPDITNADQLDEAAYQAFSLTIDALTPKGLRGYSRLAYQDENQPAGDYSRTFLHETRVGGLLLSAGVSPEATIAGALHDTGKASDTVRPLLSKPGRFTQEERAVVANHAAYGATALEGALRDPDVNELAVFVAAHHHTPRPVQVTGARESYFWDVISLVQVADRSEALVVDWDGRLAYKADRMTHEGLLNDKGLPVMDKLIQEVLGGYAGQTYLGVRTVSILERALACMPPADVIQAGVQAQRQRQAA